MTKYSALSAFLAIFIADFAVRTAYMTGKSPLLPIFADKLGANELLLGAIVSISTITGLISKPLFGFLSDRHGQWIWLLIGTCLFCFTPLLYLGVETTSELVGLRLIHGLATAIYGPITLAFIGGLNEQPKAEWYGWFSLARTGGYILGPLIGGALLGFLSPAQVYAVTSLIALVAFLPVFFVRKHAPRQRNIACRGSVLSNIIATAKATFKNRHLAVFGVVEMASRMGVYAVKTFLPLMILANGGSALDAGIFLSIQEAAAAVVRPLAGRFSDRTGQYEKVSSFGLIVMAISLAMIPNALETNWLIVAAIFIGAGNGIYLPAALSLVAASAGPSAKGTAFGIVGALRNGGKLLGPISGGWLLYVLPVQQAFMALAILPLIAVALLLSQQSFISRAKFSRVIPRMEIAPRSHVK